jgi:DNA-directed RNA polymerase specialized sigma24 family protein
VQNAFRDAYRDYLKEHPLIVQPDPDQETPPPIDSPDKEPVGWLIIKETAELVLVELQKEKRPCPQVVRMRIWEKMPYEEIALIVGLSVSRCRGVYFDNKKAVKHRLLRKYPGEFPPFPRP